MQVWIRFVVPCFHKVHTIGWSQCPCSSMVFCTKQLHCMHFYMLDSHPTNFRTFHLADSVMGLPSMRKYLWIRDSVKLFPTFKKKLQKFGKIHKQLTIKAIILIFMGPLPTYIHTNFTVKNILQIQKSGNFYTKSSTKQLQNAHVCQMQQKHKCLCFVISLTP
jgi:hypothetical protein